MVSYLNSIKDRESKLCTPEIFEQLTTSPMVAQLIEDYRKGNEKAKSLLPSFMFQGYDPNVLLGKTGSRLAKNLKPTGLFILDFDHVSTAEMKNEKVKNEKSGLTPSMLYDRFLQKLPSMGLDLQRDVALAHITPSGDGLRLVLKLPEGKSIEEAQMNVAEAMGVKMDGVVKDLSRQSFCPMASDILYINKVALFANPAMKENPVRDALSVAQGDNPGIQNAGKTPSPSGEASVIKEASPKGEDVTDNEKPGVETPRYNEKMPMASAGAVFPECYNGIPYKRIVEELILLHGGEPQVGNRENTIFRLASDLAKITDRSAPWLESLIPTFGLPEQEWRTTIAQVCKEPQKAGMSRKLQEAIQRCQAVKLQEEAAAEESNEKNEPPKMPKRLPRLVEHLISKVPDHLKPAVCMMSYPALAAHVSNALFTMMDDHDEELGLACCLFAPQSSGKSSVIKPIEHIMKDIDQLDDIQRERLRLYNEERKNKKANEKGKSKPRVAIRWLDEDITSAAFLERLRDAEEGDDGVTNYCCYTHTDEIEKLYNFNSSGSKAMIRQTIKGAFDRARVGSTRVTSEAVNAKTHLRWNWTASSTIENGKDFFSGKMVTDGAVSRVNFCTIITPNTKERFKYGRYDKEWRDGLKPYIDRLNDFRCEKDEDGEIIPCFIPEARRLEEELDALIDERNAALPDDVYQMYGRRCKIMTVRMMITTYIAEGQVWGECYDEFARWIFDHAMWNKMAFFYEAAAEKFKAERVVRGGRFSPLAQMKKVFTFSEFAACCQKNADKFKRTPSDAIYTYRHRGLIRQEGDKYIIADSFCAKHGIK